MEIVSSAMTQRHASQFRFHRSFLEPYYEKGDPFETLLARSTYLTKYCRGGTETWTDTICRVVEGNAALAPGQVSQREAEKLFHFFWTGQALPPGRALWVGGVEGIPADARFNCWYTTLRGVDDWCWAANQLMLGGGVGIGLTALNELPGVAGGQCKLAVHCGAEHPDLDEVKPDPKSYLNGSTPIFVVPDSREGWVEALRRVLTAAFECKDLILDVSLVRRRGSPIRHFGGIACGPGPLVNLLRNSWAIVRSAAGRKLNSVQALDITNHIGLCIKSGNVRRSALITLGEADDVDFRNAKKDWEAVKSHRHTSNNSIVFHTYDQIKSFDWSGLVDDILTNGSGEPGLLNLWLGRKTDPGVMGVNPCGEVLLHDREACNLAEVYPAKFHTNTDAEEVFRLVTRYTLRQRLTPLSDVTSHEVAQRNMRLGVGLGGLCDFDWTPRTLTTWYHMVREEATNYAHDLGVSVPITTTTVKPSGTTSLLNGSSPGMRAPESEYYIRRTRIAVNDPLVPAFMEAGVPHEMDIYDKTGKTYVFAFPMKAPHTRVTVQSETIRDQFERQWAVQRAWADNAVSATLSFGDNEHEELKRCLAEYVPHLKSTTAMPKSHGYAQAPFEPCNRETYEKMASGINHDHKLVLGGDIEIEECSGGVCPLR